MYISSPQDGCFANNSSPQNKTSSEPQNLTVITKRRNSVEETLQLWSIQQKVLLPVPNARSCHPLFQE